jgi:hypothetical protein
MAQNKLSRPEPYGRPSYLVRNNERKTNPTPTQVNNLLKTRRLSTRGVRNDFGGVKNGPSIKFLIISVVLGALSGNTLLIDCLITRSNTMDIAQHERAIMVAIATGLLITVIALLTSDPEHPWPDFEVTWINPLERGLLENFGRRRYTITAFAENNATLYTEGLWSKILIRSHRHPTTEHAVPGIRRCLKKS